MVGEQLLSHERYRRIAWSGITATAAKLVAGSVGLISIPIVINHVGKEEYGLWMAVSSLILWMQLADFGVTNGLTNALAEANGRNDIQSAKGYLATAFFATTAIAIILLPLLYFGYRLLPWDVVLNIQNPRLQELASDCFLIIGIGFLINIPLSLAGRVYIAFQKAYAVSLLQIVASAFTLCGLWLGVYLDLDLRWLAGIAVTTPMVPNLILWTTFSRLGVPVKLQFIRVQPAHLRRVAASSVPLFVFQVGALLVNQLVNVAIANISSLSMVADYNVIHRIYMLVFSLAAGLSIPYYAAIRDAFERGDMDWARQATKNGLLVRLIVVVPLGTILLSQGDQIIDLWLGATMGQTIGHLGWCLVVTSMVLASVSSLLSEVLLGLDDIWVQILLVTISAIVALTMMAVLIPDLGVAGVFAAMSASTLLPILCSGKRLSNHFRKTECSTRF